MRRTLEQIAAFLHRTGAIREDAEIDATLARIDQAAADGPNVHAWARIVRELGQDRLSDPQPLVKHARRVTRDWPSSMLTLSGPEIAEDIHRPQAPLCQVARTHHAPSLCFEGCEDMRALRFALSLVPIAKTNRALCVQNTIMDDRTFDALLKSPSFRNGGGPLCVSLRNCGLGDDLIVDLLGANLLDRVELLDLAGNNLSTQAIRVVLEWARMASTLKALRISDNPGVLGHDERLISLAYDNTGLLLVDMGGPTGHHAFINEPTRRDAFSALQASYI